MIYLNLLHLIHHIFLELDMEKQDHLILLLLVKKYVNILDINIQIMIVKKNYVLF